MLKTSLKKLVTSLRGRTPQKRLRSVGSRQYGRSRDCSAVDIGAVDVLEQRSLLTSLIVGANDVRSASFSLDTIDEPGGGQDNLTINETISVESTGGSVTLNVGDDLLLRDNATVSGASGVFINLDVGNADVGVGSTVDLRGSFGGNIAFLNGNTDDDSFLLWESSFANTSLNISGGDGHDSLTVDLTSVSVPQLRYTGEASGVITSASHAPISFNGIEDVHFVAGTGVLDKITFDLEGLASHHDGIPDLIEMHMNGPSSVELVMDGKQLYEFELDTVNKIYIDGGEDVENLIIDYSQGMIDVPIEFHGGALQDGLAVIGDRQSVAIYSPDGTLTGNGLIDVGGNMISATGITGFEISEMLDVQIHLPHPNDVLTIRDDVSLISAAEDAILINGSSGPTSITSLRVHDNVKFSLETPDDAGVDTLVVSSLDNDHGNENVYLAAGLSHNDRIILNGDIKATGDVKIKGAAILLGTDVTLESTNGGHVDLLNVTVDGPQQLTIKTTGESTLEAELGQTTPLTAVHIEDSSPIHLGGHITTSGEQTYEGDVQILDNIEIRTSLVTFGGDVNSEDGEENTLTIFGDFVLEQGLIGNTMALREIHVSGTSQLPGNTNGTTTVITANGPGSGAQVFTGGVTLVGEGDVHLNSGFGDITFGSTVDGPAGLVIDSQGTTEFNDEVGQIIPLSRVVTDAGGATILHNPITTTGDQIFGDTVAAGTDTTFTGNNVIFDGGVVSLDGEEHPIPISASITLGSTADAIVDFRVEGKVTPGVDYEQLQVEGGVSILGTLHLSGEFTDVGEPGDEIILVQNDGTDPVTGTFNNLPAGSPLILNGQVWRISYEGGTGNDVSLLFDMARVSVSDASVAEGDDGTAILQFSVTADAAAGVPFRVTFATADLTAGQDDYFDTSGIVSFNGLSAGEVQTVNIPLKSDQLVELDETLQLNLTGVLDSASVGILVASATGTITDDDTAQLSIADVSQAEGDSGTTIFTFSVTSDSAVDGAFTVDAQTSDDTATVADNDFVATNRTLSFTGQEGEVVTFDVAISGDVDTEGDEAFFVDLLNVSAGGRDVVVSDAQAVGTITEDDLSQISFSSSSTETVEGGTATTITVTADKPVSSDQSFDLVLSGSDGVDASDYTLSSSTLTIRTGQTSGSITFTVNDDDVVELTETVTLELSGLPSATLPGDTMTHEITITDDDVSTLTVSNATVVEGDEGARELQLDVVSSSAVDSDFSFDFATANDTAIAGFDYTATSGTLSFSGTAGETRTITVNVLGDQVVELDETFHVDLSGLMAMGRNVQLESDMIPVTIQNDDTASISISDVFVAEGHDGGSDLTFSISLDNAVDMPFTLLANTVDGEAEALTDYTPLTDRVVSFSGTAGEVVRVTVPVLSDRTIEDDETLLLNLSDLNTSGRSVSLADAQGVGMIVSDDDIATVELFLSTTEAREDEQTVIVVTATSTLPVFEAQTVNVEIAGQGITSEDYLLSSDTITIPEGRTTGSVILTIVNDRQLEANEELATVSLSTSSTEIRIGEISSETIVITSVDRVVLDSIEKFPGLSPELTWAPMPGAAYFEMWFSRISPAWTRLHHVTDLTETSWTVPETLEPGIYRYWVRGFSSTDHASSWSFSRTFEVQPKLTAALRGAFTKRPTFEWEPIPLATDYEIFLRSVTGDQVIKGVTSTHYTPSEDLPDGLLRWWVRSGDAVGNRGWSHAGILGIKPSTVIQSVDAGTSDSDTVIRYANVEGAGRYIVQIQHKDTHELIIRDEHVTATEYSIPLKSGSYRVWVKVLGAENDDFNLSAWSSGFDFTVAKAESDPENGEETLIESTLLLEERLKQDVAVKIKPALAQMDRHASESPSSSSSQQKVRVQRAVDIGPVLPLPKKSQESRLVGHSLQQLEVLDELLGDSLLVASILN